MLHLLHKSVGAASFGDSFFIAVFVSLARIPAVWPDSGGKSSSIKWYTHLRLTNFLKYNSKSSSVALLPPQIWLHKDDHQEYKCINISCVHALLYETS